MFRRFLLAAMVMANGSFLSAQIETSATLSLAPMETSGTLRMAPDAESPAPTVKDDTPALAFLRKLEAKNAETKSLYAEFTQVRTDTVMLDEVKSTGKFWYQSPNHFHASYKSENSSEIWMDGKQYIEYIPTQKQVDVVEMKTGEDAPISQLLLGFGVKVSKIQKLFAVKSAKSDDPNVVAINFVSKDLDRTMNFSDITVDFDKVSAKPLAINLQDDQSTITMKFGKIELNPKIKPEVFEVPKKWPEGTDVTPSR